MWGLVQSSMIGELCQNWSGLLALASDPCYFGWVSWEHSVQISDCRLLLIVLACIVVDRGNIFNTLIWGLVRHLRPLQVHRLSSEVIVELWYRWRGLKKHLWEYGWRGQNKFYTRRWTSPCTVMYGDVRHHIWATFGGCQPLLVTLTNFALNFTWVVLNRQHKAQNL
jgi:hypothetical protein